ncbi:MAG: hypothetical protein CM1200mP26_14460 [Acidimicrobiales bacterium]|nr:MAG: hypothetical protein CM1200mP26_14460 [Acidimicrobiales bacterium]
MGRRAARGPRSGGSVRGYQRADRLNELLVRILAEELERIDDDRLGFVTVAGVETDQDLSIARVFLISDVDDADLLKARARSTGPGCSEPSATRPGSVECRR